MREEEIRATGELIGSAFGGTANLIRDTHQAIAGRPFRALGVLALPVRAIHDRVAASVYAGVRRSLAALPQAGASALALRAPKGGTALSASPAGNVALAALNGAIGDSLTEQSSELALSMSIRHRGRDLNAEAEELALEFPDATPRLALFVHGLCETDEAWQLPLGGVDAGTSYGSRMRDELGYTPVYIRYNTGLHISENGRRLSELLGEFVEAWPTQVDEIVLVGHSMGGLVVRSACHYGRDTKSGWVEAVDHVFCLGSPHLGAPLEKAANAIGHALTRLPETRPIGAIVNGRSVGIKDLRFGSLVDEDWGDHHPDEFLKDRCREVPFLDSATHYFIGATLTRDHRDPLGHLVGDLLVRFPSASGQGKRRKLPFELEHGHHLGGLTHFHLLNHPAVYEQIRAWLTGSSPRPSAPQAA